MVIRRITSVKIMRDERGSVLPLIAAILLIFILLGAYEIGNILVYRDRAIVRDAIDAAVTSALSSGTVVQSKSTNYGEHHVVETGTDEKGNTIVIADYWDPFESNSKNYIYLDRSQAEDTAKYTFNKIITENKVKASLISWNFSVVYDDGRYLTVTQNRGHTPITSSWWQVFGDSDPTPWDSPSYEQKMVKFPRWVKVSISVNVTVPISFGGVFGKTAQNFTWSTEGIKELSADKVTN